jgi:2-keto-4-pentenoate hydratase/2-oxohepta-3-ene-1,7-dioic acid hydratase in catechol pathway
MKPAPAIAAFNQDIVVPRAAQGMDLDYEGELVL